MTATVHDSGEAVGDTLPVSENIVFEVEARVALMRRLGIKRLDMAGWEVELWQETPVGLVASDPAPTETDVAALFKGPPEGEDALFWSTNGPLPSEVRDAEKAPQE